MVRTYIRTNGVEKERKPGKNIPLNLRSTKENNSSISRATEEDLDSLLFVG